MQRVVLLFWLALALMGCAPSATPTPLPPTPDLRATETQIAANIFATQTASVPTATSTPTQTPTPLVTATSTLQPGVMVDDDFSSRQAAEERGWEFGTSSDGIVYRNWSTNQLTLTVNKTNWIFYEWPDGSYSNFGVEIEAQPKSAYAEYGIAFRITGNNSTRSYYLFGITTEGECVLRKFFNGQWAKSALIPFTASDKIKTNGAKNKIGVLADASEISLYVNGFIVATVSDDSIAKGGVGIYTDTGNSTRAEVAFNRLTMYTVEKAKTSMGNNKAPLTTRTPTRTATPKATATPAPTSTPSLPAKIVATLVNPIPCSVWNTNGCQWNFLVSFEEKNGTAATINRIGRRFVDARGQSWTVGSSEWSDQTIKLSPHGMNVYSSWVRTSPGSNPDLRDGTAIISYSGTDEFGNAFNGSVSAKLAPGP